MFSSYARRRVFLSLPRRITMTRYFLFFFSFQIKLYNLNFGINEKIEYMGWVNEGVLNNNHPWQSYCARFMIIRGRDVLLFETPPVSTINYMYIYIFIIHSIETIYLNYKDFVWGIKKKMFFYTFADYVTAHETRT